MKKEKTEKNTIMKVSLLVSLVLAYSMTYAVLRVPRYFYHAPIGYGSWQEGNIPSLIAFSILTLLVLVGIRKNWSSLSLLGSIGYFIPTIAHFTWGMYLIYGIGVLRILWRPITDFSFLGNIIRYPLEILVGQELPTSNNLTSLVWFSEALMLIGFFILFFSIFNYLYGKFQGKNLIDFWAYKYIRHPQYLGYVVWSYGTYARTNITSGVWGEARPHPLPWVISFLLVICIALNEEIVLRVESEDYRRFYENSVFMIPLPRIVFYVLLFPYRVLSRKFSVDNKRDLFMFFCIYFFVFSFLSYLREPRILFTTQYTIRRLIYGSPLNSFFNITL